LVINIQQTQGHKNICFKVRFNVFMKALTLFKYWSRPVRGKLES